MDRITRTSNQLPVLAAIPVGSIPAAMNVPPNELKAKVLKLGRDLSAFLDEQQNPKLDPRILRNQPWEEAYAKIAKAGRPHIEVIHSGYVSRFKQRTMDLFNELAEHEILVPEIHAWEIDPREVMPEKNVRKIAERLLKLARKWAPTTAQDNESQNSR